MSDSFGLLPHKIHVGADGKTYGTWPVLLSNGVEVKFGIRMGRYGGVMSAHEGNEFTEESDGWWISRGWTITDPPIPKTFDRGATS